MKIMKIRIQNEDDFYKELKNVVTAFDNKNLKSIKSIKKDKGISFESMAAVRKILTDKRLEVWRAIRDQHPESITHLSKILGRGFRSVHRDVGLLEELGLIKLIEGPGTRGNVQQLVSLYDELALAVA